MIRFIALFSLCIVSSLACSSNKNTQVDSSKVVSKSTQVNSGNKAESKANKSENSNENLEEKVEDNDPKVVSIKNSLGLITLTEKYGSSDEVRKNKNDFIRFYNEDGSLWYEFTFYYDDIDGKFEYENNDFRAFAFHPDYFLLSLRAIGEDKNRYKVIVNEEKAIAKYVKKNDKNLKLQTWETHLLETFSIELKKGKNQIFDSPNGKVINLDVKTIERFEAVETKGDWLKVKWEIPNKTDEYKSGWVLWKKDDVILVDWFYFA